MSAERFRGTDRHHHVKRNETSPPLDSAERGPAGSTLSRREMLQLLLAAGGGAALGMAAEAQATQPAARPAGSRPARPPNILFILTDDHALNAIGAYGSRINHTPNIDRIARGGLLFSHCTCGNSICAPSRATILTGKHSHRNGVIDNRARLDPSQPTFPVLLRRAGYETAMIGKWHLKSAPVGFDHWETLVGQEPTTTRRSRREPVANGTRAT